MVRFVGADGEGAPDALDAGERVRLVRLLQAGMAEPGEPTDQDWLAASKPPPRPTRATPPCNTGRVGLPAPWPMGPRPAAAGPGDALLRDDDLRRHAWRALAELAEQRGDQAAAAEAWKRAAMG